MKATSLKLILLATVLGLAACFSGCKKEDSAKIDASVNNLNFNTAGETKTFTVKSNVNWEMTVEVDNNQWITVSELRSGNDAHITVTVLQNNSISREAKITFSHKETTEIVNVKQKGIDLLPQKTVTLVRELQSNIINDGYQYLIKEESRLSGFVMSNGETNHMESNCFILQDNTAKNSGIRILVQDKENHGLAQGRKVTLNLKDAILYKQNGVLELKVAASRIDASSKEKCDFDAIEVTAGELDKYESMYVAIKNTQVEDAQGETVLNDGGDVLYQMEVEGSETKYGMFVESTAKFANEELIMKSGTLKGISGMRSATRCVLPTSYADFDGLTQERFDQAEGELSLEAPRIEGELKLNTEISGVKIIIPYKNGSKSTSYSYSIELSSISGIEADEVTGTLEDGDGEIVIELKGTPTASGEGTITLSGTPALTTAIVDFVVAE